MSKKLVGQVIDVLIASNNRSLVTRKQAEVRVNFEGFVGDKHSGLTRLSDARTTHYPRGIEIRNCRQVSIVSFEELEEMATAMKLPKILPEWLGANLVCRRVPKLTYLPPSTRLFFPEDAVLVVEGENLPCMGPGKVIQSQYPDIPGLKTMFPKTALHKRGLVAWVERPGVIREGDVLRVEIPKQVIYDF